MRLKTREEFIAYGRKTYEKVGRDVYDSTEMTVFPTYLFPDGSWLCWYSQAPCSRIHDQEQGWVLVERKGGKWRVVDEVKTYYRGWCPGRFREWYRRLKERKGNPKKVCNCYSKSSDSTSSKCPIHG